MAKKKDNNLMLYISIGAAIVIFLLISRNKAATTTATVLETPGTESLQQPEVPHYYCCNVNGAKSCYLSNCPADGTKVYVDFYNTFGQCNTGCQSELPPPQPAVLTCAQKAAAADPDAYYTEQFNTAQQCLNYATLDCQDKGKVIVGYAIDGTCCYYTCEAIAPQPVETSDCVSDCAEIGLTGGEVLLSGECPVYQQLIQLMDQFNDKCCCTQAPFCTDSDASPGVSGDNPWEQGTCTDNGGTHTDDCYTSERLTEWVCENNQCIRHTQPTNNNCASMSGYMCFHGECAALNNPN